MGSARAPRAVVSALADQLDAIKPVTFWLSFGISNSTGGGAGGHTRGAYAPPKTFASVAALSERTTAGSECPSGLGALGLP